MNVKKEVENIIKFIRDYYETNHLKGAILGISGGKDSGVVCALLVKALGSENVIGVTMPCHSNIDDSLDAKLVQEAFNINMINVDLTSTYDTFIKEIDKLGYSTNLENSNINLKPRLRMSTLYYLAALYSSLYNGTYLVAGTSNKDELFVGYYTKGGDNSYDIGLLNNYSVEEVIKIGEYLGVPDKVIHKTPSDGLSNKTDEEKLGVSYKEIEDVINGIDTPNKDYILKLNRNNLHKLSKTIYERK